MKLLVFQPLLRSDIPSDTSNNKVELPQLPPHLSDLKYHPLYVAQDRYSLGSPFAPVPRNLSLQIHLRRTMKLYRKELSLFRNDISYQLYMPFSECVKINNYLNAAWNMSNAYDYNSLIKTPFFLGIDNTYKIDFERYHTSLSYLKKAIDCDSVWDLPKKEAAVVTSYLSGDSTMPQSTNPFKAVANKNWRIGVTARLSSPMHQETSEEIGNKIVRFSYGLSCAYFVTNDLAAELAWRPLEIEGSTSFGGKFSFFQGLRGDIGVRFQTPIRLQLCRVGTRINVSSKFFLDKQRFKVDKYLYDTAQWTPLSLESDALASGIEFGIGFTLRKNFTDKSWPYASFDIGYRLGRLAFYESKIGGRSTIVTSTANGRQIGYNPTGWHLTFSLLF